MQPNASDAGGRLSAMQDDAGRYTSGLMYMPWCASDDGQLNEAT